MAPKDHKIKCVLQFRLFLTVVYNKGLDSTSHPHDLRFCCSKLQQLQIRLVKFCSTQKMKAICSPEASIGFQRTTRLYIPADLVFFEFKFGAG
jgi:hypothetical protein